MRAPTAAASDGVATPVVMIAMMTMMIDMRGRMYFTASHIFVFTAAFTTSYRGASSGWRAALIMM